MTADQMQHAEGTEPELHGALGAKMQLHCTESKRCFLFHTPQVLWENGFLFDSTLLETGNSESVSKSFGERAWPCEGEGPARKAGFDCGPCPPCCMKVAMRAGLTAAAADGAEGVLRLYVLPFVQIRWTSASPR